MKKILTSVIFLLSFNYSLADTSPELIVDDKYPFIEIHDGMKIIVFKYKDLPKRDLVFQYLENEDNYYMKNLILCHYNVLEELGHKKESEIFDLFNNKNIEVEEKDKTIENIRLSSFGENSDINNDDKFVEFMSAGICHQILNNH